LFKKGSRKGEQFFTNQNTHSPKITGLTPRADPTRLFFRPPKKITGKWESPVLFLLPPLRRFLSFLFHLLVLYDTLEYNTMEYYNNNMPRAIYTNEHQLIVNKLKQARAESGLGQVEVAEKLGRTQSYISKIESGQRRFDVLQLKEFAKLYKKSLDYFVK
jgi:DNA-binding XRE family transcriptional regulator